MAKAMPEAGRIRRLNGRYNLAAARRPRAFQALPKFWIFSEKPEKRLSKVQGPKSKVSMTIFFDFGLWTYFQTLSQMMAMPWPPPMQAVASP
jgi:hypothetical protein